MGLTEEQILSLLEKIANGNSKSLREQALSSLYLEYHRSVRNYIFKTFTQDATVIEEVVQDTFFEVWKQPDRFRGESKFKTWLLGIARHKTIDRLRKNVINHISIEEIEETLPSEDISISDLIHKEQIQQGLKYCLESLFTAGKLSDAHREVLHLAYIQDQDIHEIAQVLNCLESTIKTRLHYARLRIKNCLKKRLMGGIDHGE
ncbi:RNA polymerase sigma factor [Methyloglobulus sp.]|uniref:RNA polymerase sigma factor n=1 Tax=Methyloglobulus sp. TaxID=2518622 RepID=UPI0032B87381